MITEAEAIEFAGDVRVLVETISQHVRGKSEQIMLALTCLLAEGHLLIEDVPGVAKTSLAKSLAGVIGGTFRRIQFTADLLPSDVTGVRVYDQRRGQFRFEAGPVFSNVLLGDEINRASPKTQAALLEVMAEKQVTVDGSAWPVPQPFVCIGTQNPVEFYGTYALPEAQLDRFTMRVALGYPSLDHEATVIADHIDGQRPERIRTVVAPERVRQMIALARTVYLAPTVRWYIAHLVAATRGADAERMGVRLGASPRGSLALATCALVRAASDGRTFATDDDVKQLAVPVLAHRLTLHDADPSGEQARTVIEKVLSAVSVPRHRGAGANAAAGA